MYIDQAVAAIIDCVKTKKLVSPWIERKLNVSLKRVPACLSVHPAKLSTADNGTESWQIIEKVPAFKHLPAYDQVHSVRFCNGSPSSCSCPYFVSTIIVCSGIATVCCVKGGALIDSLIPHLEPMWLVASHPLYDEAKQAITAIPGQPLSVSSLIHSSQPPPMQRLQSAVVVGATAIPQGKPERRAMLNQIFVELLPRTIDSAALTSALHQLLVQHRSTCVGSTSLLMPPPLAITQRQATAGLGHASEVQNLANYDRRSKQRKATAQMKDPSLFTVYKSAAHGAQVQCMCGTTHTNDKKTAAAHRTTPVHKNWLQQWRDAQGAPSADQQSASESAPAFAATAEASVASVNVLETSAGAVAPLGVVEASAPVTVNPNAVTAAPGSQAAASADWAKATFDIALETLGREELDARVAAWRLAHNLMRYSTHGIPEPCHLCHYCPGCCTGGTAKTSKHCVICEGYAMPNNCTAHAGGELTPCVLCVVCQANKNAAAEYEWPDVVFVRPVHLIGQMEKQFELLGHPNANIVPFTGMVTVHLWRPCFDRDGCYVDAWTNTRISKSLVTPANVSKSFPFVNQNEIKNVWHAKNADLRRRSEARCVELEFEPCLQPLDDLRQDFQNLQQIALVPAPQEVLFMVLYSWVYLSCDLFWQVLVPPVAAAQEVLFVVLYIWVYLSCDWFWQAHTRTNAPVPAARSRKRAQVPSEGLAKQPRPRRAAVQPAGGAVVGNIADADAPPLVHPDYSEASLVVLKHAVKQRGLEIPVPVSESDLRSALEVHKLFLDAIADCKDGVDNVNQPIPGHYIVECGLEGDCFYHALGFLCHHRLPGVRIPEVTLEPLSAAHKGLREVLVDYLEKNGRQTSMDPFFFNSLAEESVGSYTVERFINVFEKMSLQQYCAQQRKLHVWTGVPESCMWVQMTGRALVVKTSESDPIVYCTNCKAAVGWPAAAAAVQDGAWVLHHQPQHYCALFPQQRIDNDQTLLAPADLTKNWAHYKSRSIVNGGKALRIPTLAVFKTPL